MNKLLIVLLAVCLVAVHGYVKRDAPPENDNYLEKIKTSLDDIAKDVSQKFKETFNPDDIKKNVDQIVSGFNKFIEDAKPKPTTA